MLQIRIGYDHSLDQVPDTVVQRDQSLDHILHGAVEIRFVRVVVVRRVAFETDGVTGEPFTQYPTEIDDAVRISAATEAVFTRNSDPPDPVHVPKIGFHGFQYLPGAVR